MFICMDSSCRFQTPDIPRTQSCSVPRPRNLSFLALPNSKDSGPGRLCGGTNVLNQYLTGAWHP